MSRDASALHLGAADRGDVAHDMSGVDGAEREATEAQAQVVDAVEATSGSQEVESREQKTLPSSNLVDRPPRDPSHDAVATGNHTVVTGLAPDSVPNQVAAANGHIEPDNVEPSSTSIPPQSSLPRDPLPAPAPRPNTGGTADELPPSANSSQQQSDPTSTAAPASQPDAATGPQSVDEGKMIFGPNGAGSAAHRRRAFANTGALTEYEADLTSRDRAKQKEAVKRYLAERVKNDWKWEWPPLEDKVASPADPLPGSPEGLSETVTEDQWKERDEWSSNASETGEEVSTAISGDKQDSHIDGENAVSSRPTTSTDETIKKRKLERKRRHKKRLAEEMAWNDGIRCFVQRRDAWTGARRVGCSTGVKTTAVQKDRASTPETGGSSTAIEQEDSEWELDTEIPIAPPILPPENAMRSSITPAAYNTIYDKVIIQQLTPSCPMNLKDVTRSCVQGWKRDGEWPPKPTETPRRASRRMSLAGFFSFEKEAEKEKEEPQKPDPEKAGGEKEKPAKGIDIKKSIRKILFRKDKEPANGNRN